VKRPKKLPREVIELRALPVEQRVEAIIAMHRVAMIQMKVVMNEWATFMLEHVVPASARTRRRPKR
jgi:hypothetical protein